MSNKNITIEKSNLKDVDDILKLYNLARAVQKEKNAVPWGKIDRTQVEQEINDGRQYKLLINGEIATVWLYTFNDKEIWQEKNKDSAIYIHRIATNPKFRGQQMVNRVFVFTEDYAKEHLIKLMGLDTAGFNKGLIKLYTKNGFNYLCTTKIEDYTNLPLHYKDVAVCLFERKVKYNFIELFFLKTVVTGAEDLSRFK